MANEEKVEQPAKSPPPPPPITQPRTWSGASQPFRGEDSDLAPGVTCWSHTGQREPGLVSIRPSRDHQGVRVPQPP